MKSITSLLKHKKILKKHAEQNGKFLIYNRKLGGYQIINGFNSSLVEYPARTASNKLILSMSQLSILYSYI